MENEMQTKLSNEKEKTLNLWYECPIDDMMKHFFTVLIHYKEDATKVIVTVANHVYMVYLCVAINNTL